MGPRTYFLGAAGLALATMFLASLTAAGAKVNPETNRIQLLLFGEGWTVTPTIMMTDPKISVTFIAAGDSTYASDMARYMRIHMPRNYEDWVSRVDTFMLSDLVPWGFTNEQFIWMRDSIEQEGTGLILSEMGWYGIGGWTGNAVEDWIKTPVYDAYPCDMIIDQQNQECPFLDLVHEGPFLDIPGIETVAFADEQGVHDPREGATVWARYRKGQEAAIVTRPFGQGVGVANSMGVERFMQPYYEWKFYRDYFINHVYKAAGVPVPDDLDLVHRIREQLHGFRDHRAYMIGMIDFIDKFNANTRPVEEMLANTLPLRDQAEDLYLDLRYEEAQEVMDQAIEMFEEIEAEAVKLREQALFWIYVIEWSAVSATFLMTGIVIWALMIRRRLYREVSVTRRVG